MELKTMEDIQIDFEDIKMPELDDITLPANVRAVELELIRQVHAETSFAHTKELVAASEIVRGRLEAQHSCVPQLRKKDVKARLFIWQAWVMSGESYQAAANLIGMYRTRGASRQHVYYIIRKMREAGILEGINAY